MKNLHSYSDCWEAVKHGNKSLGSVATQYNSLDSDHSSASVILGNLVNFSVLGLFINTIEMLNYLAYRIKLVNIHKSAPNT